MCSLSRFKSERHQSCIVDPSPTFARNTILCRVCSVSLNFRSNNAILQQSIGLPMLGWDAAFAPHTPHSDM